MGKAPSIATQNKTLRREAKRLRAELMRETARANANNQRAQAAERDAAEWRKRFDTLLSKCQTVKEPGRD